MTTEKIIDISSEKLHNDGKYPYRADYFVVFELFYNSSCSG